MASWASAIGATAGCSIAYYTSGNVDYKLISYEETSWATPPPFNFLAHSLFWDWCHHQPLNLVHLDWEGAVTFYNHLLSLGGGHNATLDFDDFDAQFTYESGTSVFLTCRVFLHSVLQWSGSERIAIAHYSKDDVHDCIGIPRPALPTQLDWWALHSSLTCS